MMNVPAMIPMMTAAITQGLSTDDQEWFAKAFNDSLYGTEDKDLFPVWQYFGEWLVADSRRLYIKEKADELRASVTAVSTCTGMAVEIATLIETTIWLAIQTTALPFIPKAGVIQHGSEREASMNVIRVQVTEYLYKDYARQFIQLIGECKPYPDVEPAPLVVP